MNDIIPSAYKVLKKLSKVENSRFFKPSDAFWLISLHKKGLAASSSVKIAENHIMGVYVITEQGKAYISDHRKKTVEKWVVQSVTLALLIAGVVISLMLLFRQ